MDANLNPLGLHMAPASKYGLPGVVYTPSDEELLKPLTPLERRHMSDRDVQELWRRCWDKYLGLF